MGLERHFEDSGNWLFERRSYLPLLLFAVVMPALIGFRYPSASHALDLMWEGVCLTVSMAGLLIRAHAVGFSAPGTSGRNTTEGQIALALNTSGLYSIVRHPLYVGNYLLWLGVALFPRAWWPPVITSLIFWLYYERIMYAEEAFLRGRFGERWRVWASRTPAFLPSLRLWRVPERKFDLRLVCYREYSGFFGMMASFTAMEFLSGVAMKRGGLDPVWVVLFTVSATLYILARYLKKRDRRRRTATVLPAGAVAMKSGD